MKKNSSLMGWFLAVFFVGAFVGSLSGGNGCQNIVEGTASAQTQAPEYRSMRALETIASEMRQIRRCQCRR